MMNAELVVHHLHRSAFPEGLGFATQDRSWCAFIGETAARYLSSKSLHDSNAG
jgi:hypothetical protein